MPPREGDEGTTMKLSEFDPLNSLPSKSATINYGSANGNDATSTKSVRLQDIMRNAHSDIGGSFMSLKSYIDEHTGESFVGYTGGLAYLPILMYCKCMDLYFRPNWVLGVFCHCLQLPHGACNAASTSHLSSVWVDSYTFHAVLCLRPDVSVLSSHGEHYLQGPWQC
jgi:hypothetical protein